ncbi:Permeases of the drug/metabolite transporter (DMT) superfamily [Gloeomargarita lithophora Alchichica-D10]|uniref:Permeases of the drug/metabolite transporter (DMT) superfamily n=1 Tax=Gloeomargarita lithophora Alchichica-D10 TaxID=1188229 RepID=A0A1J0AGV4_9CYAN|nr:DMT family transporter [Gloeomargarita lithophora]APB35177.1 Permeases of the drug/metabolite transporter (DMT) superfamily [Gloeomargarita lithophora Alchichica-D10]
MVWRGEWAALGAALLWASMSRIYVGWGKTFAPLLLNWLKGVLALGMFALTLGWRGEGWPPVGGWPLLGLALSGVLGIGVGDTAFFAALNSLGVQRTLLMDSLSPMLVTLLAWATLGEGIQAGQLGGMGLTVTGVVLVVTERPVSIRERFHLWPGLGWGGIFALSQAAGVVLSRWALVDSPITPLWSTTIRLLAGVLVLGLGVNRPVCRPGWQALRQQPAWLWSLTGTAFLSTYVGIWLQQTALKWAPAGIAQTLSSTSPLFALGLARGAGERVSRRAWWGVGIALAGCWWLFQG